LERIDLLPWLLDIDWVIQGGESGRNASSFDLDWAKSLIEQCGERRVPYFLKQLGSYVVEDGRRLAFTHGHAGDWSEWPVWSRVRQLPTAPGPLRASPC
jgi:protein gp37